MRVGRSRSADYFFQNKVKQMAKEDQKKFRIEISATGSHGCERRAKPGEKLHNRCGSLRCPDCLTHDFMQLLKQKGYVIDDATFTHAPNDPEFEVVDDMKTNTRVRGEF